MWTSFVFFGSSEWAFCFIHSMPSYTMFIFGEGNRAAHKESDKRKAVAIVVIPALHTGAIFDEAAGCNTSARYPTSPIFLLSPYLWCVLSRNNIKQKECTKHSVYSLFSYPVILVANVASRLSCKGYSLMRFCQGHARDRKVRPRISTFAITYHGIFVFVFSEAQCASTCERRFFDANVPKIGARYDISLQCALGTPCTCVPRVFFCVQL